MISFYTIIALITAGVCLVTGLINFFIGLHHDGDKADLLFGIMGLSMFIFFIWPPVGFILKDQAPYALNIEIKRIFNFAFTALFPWFALLYTGYKKKLFPYIINGTVVICYLSMVVTKTDSQHPFWVYLVLVVLGMNVIFGLYTGYLQWKGGKRKDAAWFLTAMVIFAIFCTLAVINQVGDNYFGKMFGSKLFFPINLYPLAFMMIMSIRLRENIFEKYRLEKVLRWRDTRWNSLVQNMHLLIIELDTTGVIRYVNPYAVATLGYLSEAELLNKNWFDTCMSKNESASARTLYRELVKHEKLLPHYKGTIVSKNGAEHIINWTYVFIYDDRNVLVRTMSIGMDITKQEKAVEEVISLRSELEKELLPVKENQLIEGVGSEIIGKGEAIVYAIQKAKQVAATNANVLLEGETGVGKELFANLIHDSSFRNKKAFVKVNCASLPPELIESELFGHEKGAFTGALQMRKGRFELADGGTIFLDEIGELPVPLQPKLLRVLQNGEFERIGGQQTLKVDVRVIAATNRNLQNEVKAGHFREDLFYRLHVFPITIPALRNRKEDIPYLVAHYVSKFSTLHNKQVENISKADMIRLTEYSWPGNIRELINLVERSIISATGNSLKPDWQINTAGNPPDALISLAIEEVEKTHILRVLEECNWKINGENGAAEKLKLHPNTLRSRLKKLNIKRPRHSFYR